MVLSFWYHIIKMITHNIINDTVYIGKRQEKQKSIQSIQLTSIQILHSVIAIIISYSKLKKSKHRQTKILLL